MKRCTKCKKLKNLSSFYIDRSRKDGLGYMCKKCRRQINKIFRRKQIQILHELKSNGCSICGYNTYPGALDFHHVNPKDKKFTLSAQAMNRKTERVINELNKCILLCKNCHAEIRINEGYQNESK
jgi:5-methylcytosine-specific restriction endonuclease McrA